MIGISIANSLGLNKLSGINPDAQAFITATGITGTTEINAVNALVKGLKADGLWSKMKAVYPFVTDNRNLASYTEDFSNAFWQKNSSTVSVNTTMAPNGTMTADSLTEANATADHYISTITNGFGQNGNNTFSIYAKANTRNWLFIYINNGTNALVSYFNLSNGTLGTVQSGLTANIENVGNGWYRCSVTRNWNFALGGNGGYGIALNDNVTTYAGNGTSGIFVWGAQVDASASATTYQPIATTQQAYIASQFKYNLVNPVDSDAAFRLVFNGGWTHSSTGATPNGTNGYADTKLNPNSIADIGNNYMSLSTYTNSNLTGSNSQSIAGISGVTESGIAPRWSSNQFFAEINDSVYTNIAYTNTTSQGFYISNKNNTGNITGFKSGVKVIDGANLSVAKTNCNLFIGARNNTGFGTDRYSNYNLEFSHIGLGLTDTEASNLYSRVQQFQVSLSRNV